MSALFANSLELYDHPLGCVRLLQRCCSGQSTKEQVGYFILMFLNYDASLVEKGEKRKGIHSFIVLFARAVNN